MKGLLALVGLVAIVAIVASYIWRSGEARQPIQFSHKAHIDKKVKCKACHTHFLERASAGVPTLEDCMTCHEGAQSKDPMGIEEERRLSEYAERKQEIGWVKLVSLPDHAFFSHRQHVVLAKIECATCHGPVGESTMLPTYPLVKVSMDWCVGCHTKRKAETDCLACHK